MLVLLKIIWESIAQALGQLRANKLRSFLSFIGISIGILCIIGVLSGVDSLEANIRGSLQKLGNDVFYVKKWPWKDVSGEWWNYIKRPHPAHEDYEVVSEKSKFSQLTAFHVVIGFRTVKYRSSSVDGTILIGVSSEFEDMFQMEYEKGRYFSPAEYNYGSNKIILGYEVADQLFGSIEPIGKQIKMSGKGYEVIGVIEKAGNDLLNPLNFDEALLVSYPNARTLANLKAKNVFDATVTVKAAEGIPMQQLKDEVRGILRAHRRLKPRERDDFSLNELSMISTFFDSFFGVLNLVGWIIGLFAILVGLVGVANIMFVSVKERTSIIGIKKALGAKKYIILLEFLIESVVLCLVGGFFGLFLVYIGTTILAQVLEFELFLSFWNVVRGISLSVFIGVIAGVLPAWQAANMDPVEAMRK